MNKPPTTKQLQRRLTAAESLCVSQAEKIKRLTQERDRLKARLEECEAKGEGKA